MNSKARTRRKWLQASLVLAVILNGIFFPVIWGGKTLLDSAWLVSSVMPGGAYHPGPTLPHFSPTPDPGAPGWTLEPWIKTISEQYLNEHRLPLWNPYSAYGTPLAAAMLSQPFYPLTILLSLHATPWTYNLFIIGRLFLAGLLTFFFARLFLGYAPSLFSAISFMLTGYFILYLDMPHVSVEVLLPGMFLALEVLLRKNSWQAVAGTSAVTFLCITGGMPESCFLIVSFGCLYFLFRLLSASEFSGLRLQRLINLALGLTLGFGLAAFLLAPFLEYMRIAHDAHQAVNLRGAVTGLEIDDDWRTTTTYLLPGIFGRVVDSIFDGGWTGMRSYWGILPIIFASGAVLRLTSKSCSAANPLRSLTVFFLFSLVLMLLKRFGNPLVNWIGRLPVADLIIFVKYDEPLMAFCIAMLAGIGFSLFQRSRIGSGHYFAATLLVLVLILGLAGWSWPRVLEHKDTSFIFYSALIGGMMVILAALLLFGLSTQYLRAAWLPWAFLGLLSLELCFNFIYPNFYGHNVLPSAESYNPYSGAPYIDFLRLHNTERYRVFAREGILYPNWAGVFKLMDVRDLDAMYYRRYINFIRNFLLRPGDHARLHGELADRFTGSGDGYSYDHGTDVERRFLALSSIRYVMSTSELGTDTSVINEVVNQHQADNLWGFGVDNFPIGGSDTALGVFQHAPSRRLSFKTVIDPARPVLEGVASIKTGAQDKSAGVEFLLEIKSADKIEPLFSTFLNPKDVARDRGGRPFHIDLNSYAGRDVELLLSTDPGPSGNNAYDWAGWAALRFVPAHGEPAGKSPFKNIYHDEVRIYEFTSVLPRATLYFGAEILPDKNVLDRLKDPTFNLEQRIILSAEMLSEADRAILQSYVTAPPLPYASARIVSYDSQRVQIETQSDAPAILMLNDANYPGWRAFVNGRPASILPADYLFRGVIVPTGRATVEFDYAPASFRIGALISLASLVVLVIPLFGLRVWRSKHATARRHEIAPDVGSIAITEPMAHSLQPAQPPARDWFAASPGRNTKMKPLDDLDIFIRSRKGKIFAGIPQLGLLAKGENVEAALAALDVKKKELATELEEAGELDTFEIGNQICPTPRRVTMTAPGDLGRFAIKTGIVVSAIAAVFLICGTLIASEVEGLVNDIKSVGGVQFWGHVEQQLDRMASSDLPEAKKQKLLADIHAIAVRWRPFIVEVQSALSGPPNQTPPTTTPTNR